MPQTTKPQPERTTAARSPVDLLSQLGDPIRLRMLRLLAREELSVGEIVAVLHIPQSSGSRHLKVLSDGGWVCRRSVGTTAYYSLREDDLDEDARRLWAALRESAGTIPEATEDDQRLSSVIAQRVTDSRTFFGKHARRWDALRGEMFGTRFTDQSLLGLIDPTWRIADLGCGTGNCAEILAPWAEQLIAIDGSEEMLSGAKQRLQSVLDNDDHITFVKAELHDIPLDSNSVDAAVCMLVMHHLTDPLGSLKEIKRILTNERGGGVALIVDMMAHDRLEYKHELGHEHLGFTPQQLTDLCTQAGFTSVRVTPIAPSIEAAGPPLVAAAARI